MLAIAVADGLHHVHEVLESCEGEKMAGVLAGDHGLDLSLGSLTVPHSNAESEDIGHALELQRRAAYVPAAVGASVSDEQGVMLCVLASCDDQRGV